MSIVADIHHTRMFPDALGSGAKRALIRVSGAVLTMTAIAGWLALATWSNQDPSLSNATNGAARNLLGLPGASVADLLFQTLGLASLMLFLPMAAWGWHLLTLITPNRVTERLILWPLSLGFFAGALAGLPVAGGWPLPVSLGGLIGDHVIEAATIMGSFIGLNGAAARILTGLALPVLSFWGLSAACGIKPSNYALLWQRGNERAKPIYDDQVIEYIAEPRATDNPYDRIEHRVAVIGHVDHMGRIEPFVTTPAVDPAARTMARSEVSPVLPAGISEAVLNASEREWMPRQAVETPAMVAAPARQAATSVPVFAYDPQTDHKRGRTKVIRGEQLPLLDLRSDGFPLPPLEFLEPTPYGHGLTLVNDEMLQARADQLEQVLEDFKVKGDVIDIKPGPVVTLYEFEPARGIKSSQVIGLADDIARIMGAVSARVAVIPGRNAIGIELPNEKRETVYLREQLEAIQREDKKAKLPLVLGKNIAGDPTAVDLAKMPHLLIAGTTGSGKSVGINTMILSLLYNLSPEQCKFIMIDPKMLELSVYDGIPHLLAPVVTDPKKAVVALNWTVKEMDDRYRKMSQIGVRNIGGFNTRIKEAKMRGDLIYRTVQTGFDQGTGQPIYEQEKLDYQEMPYIVVVIDEMADLMMVAGKEIEGSVQRLAQKARAAGIHLITATQRPSVDVITGTIKANFPTRISFQVTSKIDSRTILGEMGAEQLLGAGDMLYMAGGGQITRVHGSYVSDDEVARVANYLRAQGVPQYLDAVTRDGDEEEELPLSSREVAQEKFDDLYDEAVAIVVRDQKASTSYVQRRLGIGYNKAATLIERMQDEGIISAPNHAGKRDILVGRDNQSDF